MDSEAATENEWSESESETSEHDDVREARVQNPITDDDHCVLNKSSASSRARILVASSAHVRSSSKFRTNCDAWAELLMTHFAA